MTSDEEAAHCGYDKTAVTDVGTYTTVILIVTSGRDKTDFVPIFRGRTFRGGGNAGGETPFARNYNSGELTP